MECFLYDPGLDRCSYCLAGGRCLRGAHTQSSDFFCICPPCHSGKQCQFNTKSFTFTLDQLFSTDLLSNRKRTTISLLIFFSSFAFLLAIPNNLFTFITVRRPVCLRQGIGHYLLWMSVSSQVSLALLSVRLIHLVITMTTLRSHTTLGDILCKVLSYLLTCATRLSYWLPSFVALERVFTTVFLSKQWFKQPHIARYLMLMTFGLILLSTSYELVFVKAFLVESDENYATCVLEFPNTHLTLWVTMHQTIAVVNFLVPLLINIGCTCTIVVIVIKVKMNIQATKMKCEWRFCSFHWDPVEMREMIVFFYLANTDAVHNRRNVFRGVLREHSEMITRPAITLVPSIFSLFSLPLLIVSFSLGCQNLENSPLRYLLITCNFITYIPQILTFCLYVYPSSFYCQEWQATTIRQRLTALRRSQRGGKFLKSYNCSQKAKRRRLNSNEALRRC